MMIETVTVLAFTALVFLLAAMVFRHRAIELRRAREAAWQENRCWSPVLPGYDHGQETGRPVRRTSDQTEDRALEVARILAERRAWEVARDLAEQKSATDRH
jgi:hypothetical protein